MSQVDSLSYVVIPIHNRKKTTLECLERLFASTHSLNYEIVVIDDCSCDGSAEAIKALYPNVTILSGAEELWWAGAISLGMKYAYEKGAEHIIWLNDDCLVEAGTFELLVQFCQSHPNAVVGGQGYEMSNAKKISFGGKVSKWYFPLNYKLQTFPAGTIAECDMLSGNLVCFPRSAITRCGYPDFESFPHYGGDTLYLQLLKAKGFNLFVDTRKSATNILPSQSSSNVNNWYSSTGSPFKIFCLLYQPQTTIYWRLYLQLNLNQYGIFGIFLFLFKYCPTFLRILLITVLRLFIHEKMRVKISTAKSNLISNWKESLYDSSL
mgnify:CR=1 FL=1